MLSRLLLLLTYPFIIAALGADSLIQVDPISLTGSYVDFISPVAQDKEGAWELVFFDDFNGTALDESKWTRCYWWDWEGCTNEGNNNLNWYQPDDVYVSDGTVKLRAQIRKAEGTNGRSYDYTSGMITTGRGSSDLSETPRFAFQYGYAEMRAKVPAGKGLWPAFWLLPITHESRPEIDVMEILGDSPHVTRMHYHYLDESGQRQDLGHNWLGPNFADSWHTFAVSWQPDAIIWYVDDIERWRYTDEKHISSEPMYLLINLAVGGNWPGAPNSDTSFPSMYEIDYVRVWRYAPSALNINTNFHCNLRCV